MIEDKDIDTLLNESGMKFGKFEKEKVWLVVLEDGAREHRLAIQLRPDWIVVAIHPFIVKPNSQTLSELCCRLTHLNHEMKFAKLILDDTDDVGLMSEVPTDSELSLLNKSITMVAKYAHEHYAELSAFGKNLVS